MRILNESSTHAPPTFWALRTSDSGHYGNRIDEDGR
jgi:hypothetical protein